MTETTYEKISAPFRSERGRKLIIGGNRCLTAVMYLMYPVALYFSWKEGVGMLFVSVLVPALSFLILSGYRHIKNAPRPYESLLIDPIIKKDTKGNSFPSRHVFCAFLIASLMIERVLVLGIFCFAAAVIIGVLRVIGGVHYPKDVIVGAVCGILFWKVGTMIAMGIIG